MGYVLNIGPTYLLDTYMIVSAYFLPLTNIKRTASFIYIRLARLELFSHYLWAYYHIALCCLTLRILHNKFSHLGSMVFSKVIDIVSRLAVTNYHLHTNRNAIQDKKKDFLIKLCSNCRKWIDSEKYSTVPIDRILSVKNARAWVSMDFTWDKYSAPRTI